MKFLIHSILYIIGEEKAKETVKAYGKPKIGGPFNLINAENGQRFDSTKELGGKFYMVYFGFTHCPDICPEELDKMAEVVDIASKFFFSSTPPPFVWK